jgi:hypothetical protein
MRGESVRALMRLVDRARRGARTPPPTSIAADDPRGNPTRPRASNRPRPTSPRELLCALSFLACVDSKGREADPAPGPEPTPAEPARAPPVSPTVAEAAPTAAPSTGAATRMMAKVRAARPPVPAYAVVRDNTPMYISPSTSAPAIVAKAGTVPAYAKGYYYGRPADPPVPLGRAVRVLSWDGELVEIENITAEDREMTCAPLVGDLSDLRVRMWVPRDSLLPVLTEPLEVVLADKVEVSLGVGVVALRTDNEGVFRVHGDGITLDVSLPFEPLERWHLPGRPFATDGAVATVSQWQNLTWSSTTLVGSGMTPSLYSTPPYQVHLYADDVSGGTHSVTVRNRCLELRGATMIDSPGAKPVGSAVPVTTRRRPDRPPQVLAGTPLRWADGRSAGIAVAPHAFAGDGRSERSDLCYPLNADPDPVEICVSAASVERSPAGLSKADGLTLQPNPWHASESVVQMALHDAMWEHYDELRGCFRKSKGKGTVGWASFNLNARVEADGKVAPTWTYVWTSRGQSTKLQTCVEKVVGGWRLPPADTAADAALYVQVSSV